MVLPWEQAAIEAAVSPAFELCVGLVGGAIYWCREKWRGELVCAYRALALCPHMRPIGACFMRAPAHVVSDAF